MFSRYFTELQDRLDVFKDEGLQIITNDRAYLAAIKLNQNVRIG